MISRFSQGLCLLGTTWWTVTPLKREMRCTQENRGHWKKGKSQWKRGLRNHQKPHLHASYVIHFYWALNRYQAPTQTQGKQNEYSAVTALEFKARGMNNHNILHYTLIVVTSPYCSSERSPTAPWQPMLAMTMTLSVPHSQLVSSRYKSLVSG